ncbi:Heptaprenylglyceryl phosphate synthase [Jeotgalicoccus saudimassiliensis]|uniref:Heptaprenylglyceryl phosphate synthase n=1 Tax=Jeotgalicoccus saudimassiliensis TaxID=1461582 RepID=A0A078MC09_9STAP|nr:heptaprenylglyceryl phosphate synthase [Jeotgalicoccus saudimassiliensis]CEA03820.1 Heptaprenylglyceryl phosphate synthase [Jeotgalicoccus saudimassiliensis]
MTRHAKHIFKLDPAKEIDDSSLERIVKSGTDLILVSGTDNVTEENVSKLLRRIRQFDVSAALEISHPDAAVPGFNHYFIPTVINTDDVTFSHGMLVEALMEYHDFIDYDSVSLLPYIIMNQNCKAFKHAQCHAVEDEEFIAMIHMLDKLYKMDYIYIEYSGVFGDRDLVAEAYEAAEHANIVYGGGVVSEETARRMDSVSDVMVVGNIIYDDVEQALKTII